ncbi:hypothetical protein H7X87_01400 [Acetobacteraceae bacterium]|nr:hypothetical protein [Candidatus Parcubacteria bacterium]
MAADFERLISYIENLKDRYYRALSAFHVYQTLHELNGIDVHGKKKAQQNVDTIIKYKNYFIVTKEATRVYFFLELAKLFDTSKQSLHINKVVNFTDANRKKLTAEEFISHNIDRHFAEELAAQYVGISGQDIKDIRQMLEDQKEVIEKLIVYRNSWLAHDDRNRPETLDIYPQEIELLFEVLAKILNALSSKLNSTTSMWSHVKPDAQKDTSLVFEHLTRFEPFRLKEIEEEAVSELKRITNEIAARKTLSNTETQEGSST